MLSLVAATTLRNDACVTMASTDVGVQSVCKTVLDLEAKEGVGVRKHRSVAADNARLRVAAEAGRRDIAELRSCEAENKAFAEQANRLDSESLKLRVGNEALQTELRDLKARVAASLRTEARTDQLLVEDGRIAKQDDRLVNTTSEALHNTTVSVARKIALVEMAARKRLAEDRGEIEALSSSFTTEEQEIRWYDQKIHVGEESLRSADVREQAQSNFLLSELRKLQQENQMLSQERERVLTAEAQH